MSEGLAEERWGGFAERWLVRAGTPHAQTAAKILRARDRARRYPWPTSWLSRFLLGALDWLAPLALLGRLSRARNLDAPGFDALLRKAQCHTLPLVRAATLLALAPLVESLGEEEPPAAAAHPLVEFLARPRRAEESVDVVIIGSGAGGAPVAWDLARRGLSVVIVEKGSLVTADTASRVIERHYVSQGLVGSVHGGTVIVVAGSSIGGSTSINSGTCLRPLRQCLEGWDERLGSEFSDGLLDPWLETVERQIGVTTPPRSLQSASADLFERGLAALGRNGTFILPRNAPACTAAGRCCFGCPTNAKRSTDLAFLPGACEAGATLLGGTRVTAVKETASGVTVDLLDHAANRSRIHARHLVIAAGALFTPGLLRRNELGRAWRHAGRSLKIHPASKVMAHFPGLAHGEGGIPQGLGYRPPELPRIAMEGIHTPASVTATLLTLAGENVAWWLANIDALASFGLMIRDRAVGHTTEVAGLPVVDYTLDPQDAREMGEGLVLIARAFMAAGAQRVLLPLAGLPTEISSAVDLSDRILEAFTPGRLAVAAFHPQGTAGMGRVVHTDLRLMGSQRIWVCDASVLPDSPGVNPQMTIMALSLRLAERIAGELGSGGARGLLSRKAGRQEGTGREEEWGVGEGGQVAAASRRAGVCS